ncbi:hypothetical protein KCTC52924_02008 [Arenibacter antarcticus]|uniref:DUF3887 domain-containing protein n=1 Tax=Arenibacter antarcticus TaxID=2040469 RepID=A0ABW5VCA6_9FLAO|nr:hypothetical protein [Arenibacter sp. H213]MCM4168436.1 hypothetical protein [Arenibacter sp. H213]
MKKIFRLVIVLFVTTSASCQSSSDFKKVDESQLKQEDIESVKILSEKILTAQKNGGHYKLSENVAIKEMVDGLNETVQKKSYQQIKNLFGEYQDLRFESLMESEKGKKLRIYRFKGFFESESDIEIRTVLNDEGKLAGFS